MALLCVYVRLFVYMYTVAPSCQNSGMALALLCMYIYIYIYTYPVCYKERVCVCVLCPERISLEGIVPAYPEFTMMFVLGGNGPVYAEVTVLLIRK